MPIDKEIIKLVNKWGEFIEGIQTSAFQNFGKWTSNIEKKLSDLQTSMENLNKTIDKASVSSNRVAKALFGATVAGVIIAAVTLFLKYYKGY